MKKIKFPAIMYLLLVTVLCLLGAITLFCYNYFHDFALLAEAQTVSKSDPVLLSEYRQTFISDDNTGYTSESNTKLPFSPITSVSVQTRTGKLEQTLVDGYPVIKLSDAQDVSVYMEVRDIVEGTDLGGGYKLSSDSWGETQTGNKAQKVKANGSSLTTGRISTGALLVQKSLDGEKWTQSLLSKFNNGYYTTDYLRNYHDKGEKEIYVPDGMEVKQGVYISVSFFYEAYKPVACTHKLSWYEYLWCGNWGKTYKHDNHDEFINCRETHTFFLVEDSVEGVTFNNLTTADTSELVEIAKPSAETEAEYKVQEEQYANYLSAMAERISSTMYDGDLSVTGFRINVTANPYLQIELKRNGQPYALPPLKTLTYEGNQKVYEITKSGRYEITIKSYSKSKTLTLYVDNVTPDAAYERYFGSVVTYNGQSYGNEFLDYSPKNSYANRRVFDLYSDVPVFKDHVTLVLPDAGEEFPALYGIITNTSTGDIGNFNSGSITISDPGSYECVFSTKEEYSSMLLTGNSPQMSGDVRVYQFNFKIVGKDDATTINKQVLSSSSFGDLSIAAISDYLPGFYGVTRSSAGKGRVIVAFADQVSALQYARSVVWGEIESYVDEEGKLYWRIPNLDNPSGSKVISYSGWQNATVVNTLTERMVEKLYFDQTDVSTYLTLEKSVEELESEGLELTNLQLVALQKSVIVWHDAAQRQAAMASTATIDGQEVIKFVGRQTAALLSQDEEGEFSDIEKKDLDFNFMHDSLGLDSYSILAMDSTGKAFNINYGMGFITQLENNNCAPGLIQIVETNIYSEVTAKYYVYYIPSGYQPAEILFNADGNDIRISTNSTPIFASYGKVVLEGILKYIDPNSYLKVTHTVSLTQTSVQYYAITEAVGLEFDSVGQYTVSIIDRFGNDVSYTFNIV